MWRKSEERRKVTAARLLGRKGGERLNLRPWGCVGWSVELEIGTRGGSSLVKFAFSQNAKKSVRTLGSGKESTRRR